MNLKRVCIAEFFFFFFEWSESVSALKICLIFPDFQIAVRLEGTIFQQSTKEQSCESCTVVLRKVASLNKSHVIFHFEHPTWDFDHSEKGIELYRTQTIVILKYFANKPREKEIGEG